MSQVKLLLSPSPRHLNLYLLCSKGILELPNWTPGCAPRTIPHLWITVQGSALQGSPTAAGRGEGQQGDQGPSACYLMQRWVRFLPRSLGTQCWIPQLPEALLSTDRCQIVGGGRIQTRDLLFGHLADVCQSTGAPEWLQRYHL